MNLDATTIDMVWKISAVIFAAGVLCGQLKAIRKDIARLEQKQDETNKVKIRMAAAEAVQKLHQKELIELKKVIYGNRELSK